MNRGEFLTRLSIWLALIAYATAASLLLQSRGHPHWRGGARWAWTLGCVFFLVHVVCAFAYFHHWSHAEAYRETARQTAALTGWQWGGGIYTIWSDGTRMAADLYVPADLKPGEKRPAILFCAGTGGTKKGNGALYGKRFVKEGFVVLTFDYRGWGESDCKLMMTEPMPKPDEKGLVTVQARPVRWQMDLADQTLDIRCALSFLSGEPCVDAEHLGIFGTSYGGGLVTWVAGHDPRVKCVVAQVPGMGGGRGPAAMKHA